MPLVLLLVHQASSPMQAATYTRLPNDAGALMCGIYMGLHDLVTCIFGLTCRRVKLLPGVHKRAFSTTEHQKHCLTTVVRATV